MPFGPVIEKRPLELGDAARFPIDEPRWGPEREVRLPRDATAPTPRTDADGKPWGKPAAPTIVASDFSPDDFPRFARVSTAMADGVTVVLSGGPLDGQEVEVGRNQMEFVTQARVDRSELEPFTFDAAAHKRGEPNVVRGEYDNVAYHRTNDKNADGLRIYRYGKFVFSEAPAVSGEGEQA
jgi:hypothetical protein